MERPLLRSCDRNRRTGMVYGKRRARVGGRCETADGGGREGLCACCLFRGHPAGAARRCDSRLFCNLVSQSSPLFQAQDEATCLYSGVIMDLNVQRMHELRSVSQCIFLRSLGVHWTHRGTSCHLPLVTRVVVVDSKHPKTVYSTRHTS